MQIIKHCFKYILTFFIIVILLLCMLVLSAIIPRSSIKENVYESAIYLCEGELFGEVVEDVNGSKIDRYADSILLAIAYQYDSKQPLTSVMWSSYYYTEYQNENENLLDAVTNDYEANQQYVRYWHGSNVIVRPLLTFLNLKQIYVLNGIILGLLTICLLVILIRQKAYIPAMGVLAGLVGISFWFVPFSLEYSWTFLLMLLVSIIGVRFSLKSEFTKIGILFLISGMVTNFLDFLTTETLTLTVPLLLILWIQLNQHRHENRQATIGITIKAIVVWGIGYVGMWMMKWLIASIVLSENVMPYVSEHIGERLGGDLGIGFLQYIFGAIWNNIKCLFPFEYGMIGALIGSVLVLLVLYIGYVYRGKKIDRKCVLLYALIGLIPYIRYVVLHNHSYLHCFFTYRAQMATILAIVLILEQLTDRRYPLHANRRNSKA